MGGGNKRLKINKIQEYFAEVNPAEGFFVHLCPDTVVRRQAVLAPLDRLCQRWYTARKQVKTRYMKQEEVYASPQCAAEAVQAAELLCTSPKEGGLEEVTYEDWVI